MSIFKDKEKKIPLRIGCGGVWVNKNRCGSIDYEALHQRCLQMQKERKEGAGKPSEKHNL